MPIDNNTNTTEVMNRIIDAFSQVCGGLFTDSWIRTGRVSSADMIAVRAQWITWKKAREAQVSSVGGASSAPLHGTVDVSGGDKIVHY